MTDTVTHIPAAMSPEEWKEVLDLIQAGKQNGQTSQLQLTMHGTAALALYGQPYGFSQQDVDDEIQVAEYCETMARQQEGTAAGATFRLLGERHKVRALKIAALLPPKSA
jgi:hypothetical protein